MSGCSNAARGIYNNTEITFSAIIRDTNTEVTQQCNCRSTTRPRRYGRSMSARMASMRRPIRRQLQPTTRSALRRRGEQMAAPTASLLRPVFLSWGATIHNCYWPCEIINCSNRREQSIEIGHYPPSFSFLSSLFQNFVPSFPIL